MTKHNDEETANFWSRYHADKNDYDAFEGLINRYLILVKITAGRMALNVPRFITEDELVSAGSLGLLSAVQRFDPTHGVKFESYAITRIRGAILDELRHLDWASRGTRDRSNRIKKAEAELRSEGKPVLIEDVVKKTGMTREEYLNTETEVRTMDLAHFGTNENDENALTIDSVPDRRSLTPLQLLERAELKELIKEVLNKKDALLIVLYYYEELTLKEIGLIMDVTESRICQRHTEIIKKLQHRLNNKKKKTKKKKGKS